MAHLSLQSFEKMLLSFSRRQQSACFPVPKAKFHWIEYRLYAIIDGFITIFIIFLLIKTLIFGIILAASTTKKSPSS